MMPPTFSHRLSRPSRQALQTPQVKRAIHHDAVAGLERRHVGPNRGDLARRLGADDERQLALGEGHAAPAPYVDVIERHRLDADLHLAGAGRRRRRELGEFELAVGDEGERAHSPSHRLPADDQRNVLAAEAERVGERVAQLDVPRHVGDHVERYRRIGNLVIDGRRNAPAVERRAA